MTPDRRETALRALADLYDVQTSYVDANGEERHPPMDCVTAVLRSVGAAVTDPEDALRAERLRRHVQTVEPVSALPASGVQVVTVAVPRSTHPRDCWLQVETEEGEVQRNRLLPSIHRPSGSATLEGRPIDRYEARLTTALRGLPPGYHQLSIEGPGVEGSSLLVAAGRCPLPRRGWCAFLPLHALRTGSDWGVGSFTALADLVQFVTGLGGSLVGTLPLYPSPSEGPVDGRIEASPYLPATRLGWSELYVDPTVLPELEASPQARELLASTGLQEELVAARRAPLVDYPATAARVRKVLEPLARAVFAGPSSRRSELEAFARARPDMVAYARFRAGLPVEPNGGAEAASEPGGPAGDARLGAGAPAGGDQQGGSALSGRLGTDEARYHLYAQWVADQQLAAAGDHLYLDLPVGVHPDGFDTRWEPLAYTEGVEGGAPPDRFFASGQRWGFRPLHPRALREQRYRHQVDVLRHVMRRATAVRLDHVMGLHRMFFVPDGADARDGVYVRYRNEELRAICTLEAERSRTVVVGEDLGTVDDEVRQGMARDRMLRSWVLQFEVAPDAPLPQPPESVMASIGTHDLPRFAAFWDGPRRANWRRALGGDARRGLRTCHDHLAAGPARLVLVDLEDLWLERWPHNRPGTGPEARNWQHRATRTLEDLRADPEVVVALERVDHLRHQPEQEAAR